jgi:hypothetical protein
MGRDFINALQKLIVKQGKDVLARVKMAKPCKTPFFKGSK